jgi:hypothetical protein
MAAGGAGTDIFPVRFRAGVGIGAATDPAAAVNLDAVALAGDAIALAAAGAGVT